MSKKIQYQINILKEKINTYNDIIIALLEKRNTIKAQIAVTILDTKNDSNSNSDSNILKDLQDKQLSLELHQKLLKNNISIMINDIKKYENDIEYLNSSHKKNISNEDTINNEELSRIEEQKIIIIEQNKIDLDLAYIEKEKIYNEIDFIKDELTLQNNAVMQIQITSHSNRKKTLDELHMKKQTKLININSITNYKNNETVIFNQIEELQNINTDILNFKSTIIDLNYSINSDTNSDTSKLLNYYNHYNLDINLSINDKIIILDKLMNDNEKQINSLKAKYEKQKKINTFTIKNINETYNKNNRVKIIGCKDQFKIEKEIKNKLENSLKILTDKYNTFNTTIIDNINNNLLNAQNELKNDILRSSDRLNIMKKRLLDDFRVEKQNKLNLIEDSKTKLLDLSNQFNNSIKDLEAVKIDIKIKNNITNEIDSIDSEIQKYQSIIQQMTLDINKLNE